MQPSHRPPPDRLLSGPRPRRAARLALGLCLLLCGLAAAPRLPDDDADEQEMQDIKHALRADQALLHPASLLAPLAAPPPTPQLATLQDLLPRPGAVLDLGLGYGSAGILTDLTAELSLTHVLDRFAALALYGQASPDGLSLIEAHATSLSLPLRLQVRAGLVPHRFGLLSAVHRHDLALHQVPLLVGRLLGDRGGQGLGLSASWLLPLPWSMEAVATAVTADRVRSFYGPSGDPDWLGTAGPHQSSPVPGSAAQGRTNSPADLLYVLALKQSFRLPARLALSVGASVALGPNATGRANRTDLYGADVLLGYRRGSGMQGTAVTLLSEWAWRRRQVPGALLADVTGLTELSARTPGGTLLTLRHEYGSGVRNDPLDPGWTQDRHRAAAGLRVGRGQSRLGLEGSLDLTSADPQAPATEPGADMGSAGLRKSWSVFVYVLLVLGAHGAAGPYPLVP